MGKIVGKIQEVKGLSVKAKLTELLPPYLIKNGTVENSPKINGFIKTKVGLDVILCQVVGEISDIENEVIKGHILELQVIGYFDNKKFIQGLRMLPIVGAEIETIDDEDLNYIYSDNAEIAIRVGHSLFDSNKEIKVDINNLIPSHIGIFGNTGSGKSNTLTRLLYEYSTILHSKKTNRGKFIIFDLNNEYSKKAICDEELKAIYHLRTRRDSDRKIPLELSTLSEDDFVVLMSASARTQIPVVKNAYRWANIGGKEENSREESYYLNIIKSLLKNGQKSLFNSMRHFLADGDKNYLMNVEYFKYNAASTQNKFYYSSPSETIYLEQSTFQDKLNEITLNIPTDALDRFLFEIYFAIAYEHENGVQLDYMMPLATRAQKLIRDFRKIFDFRTELHKDIIFDDKNVCVIELGEVNKEMKEIIPSVLSNHIFNTLFDNKEEKGEVQQIVNIVIDEAHNILYDGTSDNVAHKNVLGVFEKVVKEGRKFGCFLFLASQRPSDISQTIISQLHNYFIHRLVNPADISKIKNAVAYLDQNSLDFITVMAAGECIVSGTAFQMPTFIYVSQVEKSVRPNSANVVLVGENGLFDKPNGS